MKGDRITIATQNVRSLGQGFTGSQKRKEIRDIFKHTTPPPQMYYYYRKPSSRKLLVFHRLASSNAEGGQASGMKQHSQLNQLGT